MIRSLNVQILHLNTKMNLDLILVDVLRYKIAFDAQLKFAPSPVKNFLSTTLVHKKVHLKPFLKGASSVKR